MIITMVDIRRNKMCRKGTKDFFERHGLDWDEFRINGIESDKLAATGDAMALKLIEECEHGR